MSRRSIVAQSKQAERLIAMFLGGRRLHAGEWAGKGDVDVISDLFVVQVKHRSGVPAYLIEGMKQIREPLTAPDELRRLRPGIKDDPIPLVAIVTKEGRGKKAQVFFVLDHISFNRLVME